MELHPAAAGFGDVAGAYERARPEYPKVAVEWLAGRAGIGPGRNVVDLAAGTGKLTRALLTTGAEITAVEPSAGMRAQLRQVLPQVRVLEGTAEAIPLRDASVDVVAAGQAFHWFRGPEALAEIHRVLRPQGALALIWNRRDLARPLEAAIQEVIGPHRGAAPSYTSGRWRQAFETTRLFSSLEEAHFPSQQDLTRELLVDRVLSTSYIAAASETVRQQVREAILRIAYEERTYRLNYITDVYWCRRQI